MKMKFSEWFRRCQLILIIACCLLPVITLLAGKKAPGILNISWIFPTVYVGAAIAGILLPGKLRVAYGVLVFAIGLSASIFLTSANELVVCILGVVLYSVVLIWSLRLGGWSSSDELTGFWPVAGFFIHLFAQIMLRSDRISSRLVFADMQVWIYGSFFLGVFLTMFSMNRKSLQLASGKRQKASRSMVRQNLGMTALLFAVCMVFALAPSIVEWIRQLLRLVGWVINWLLERFAGDPQNAVETAPMESNPFGMIPGEETAPSLLSQLLEKALLIFGVLVVAGIVGFILYKAGRTIWKFLRKFLQVFAKYLSSASEDYVDEITDTRDASHNQVRILSRDLSRVSRQEERAMSPRRRIRYRYLRLSKKHREWSHGSTARENLPQQLAELYERARYSDHPMTREDAELFAKQIKDL